MRALSIRQPWAHAIFHLRKRVENRSWPTQYRGKLAIHVSKRIDFAGCESLGLDPETLPTGCVVGIVDLVDCVRGYRSRWAKRGKWHWVLRNPRLLARPIPAIGRLGLFEWRRARVLHTTDGRARH